WLRHFNIHIKEYTVGVYRLLILDNHKSHNSLEFTEYYKENKIVTLYMPPHSSHILQPLNISYFLPLKIVYRR
ncbi:CENP-B protein, partial [Zopfia rhizophila CBS 207.26]